MTGPTRNEITLGEVIRHMRTELLPMYGTRETSAMIQLIFDSLKGYSQSDIIINEQKPVSDFIRRKVEEILTRLKLQEPIQYILGEGWFYGLKFKVAPGVLVPRPETASLVDIIVDENRDRADLRVLDLCTGSGCIAIALARNLKFPEVTAVELSPQAMAIAKENNKALRTKVKFVEADIFRWQPEPQSVDIIVSNPPYIDASEEKDMETNVLAYEPHMALFVPDDDPLCFYKRIADIGREALADNGRIYFEINPRHADEMRLMMLSSGYHNVDLERDSFDKIRFLKASFSR